MNSLLVIKLGLLAKDCRFTSIDKAPDEEWLVYVGHFHLGGYEIYNLVVGHVHSTFLVGRQDITELFNNIQINKNPGLRPGFLTVYIKFQLYYLGIMMLSRHRIVLSANRYFNMSQLYLLVVLGLEAWFAIV